MEVRLWHGSAEPDACKLAAALEHTVFRRLPLPQPHTAGGIQPLTPSLSQQDHGPHRGQRFHAPDVTTWRFAAPPPSLAVLDAGQQNPPTASPSPSRKRRSLSGLPHWAASRQQLKTTGDPTPADSVDDLLCCIQWHSLSAFCRGRWIWPCSNRSRTCLDCCLSNAFVTDF